jgi:NAD(P)-dependent dehydrogenase (short-subunit alcohol dehydrogenase family)
VPTYELEDKVLLVTGGARGIGLETARIAHERGARVALLDLDAEAADEAASGFGDRGIGVGVNVTEAAAVEAAVTEVRERFGRVDVVVANAGITPPKTTTRALDPETWEQVVEVNLMGVWRTVRAALPDVIANRGQAVLIASSYAHVNGVLNSSYAVSKSAVEAFGRSLRVELAAHEASATIAYFGYVETGINTEAFADPLAEQFRSEVAPSFLIRPIPAGQAAGALVDGIERRAARVIEPPVWRIPFYLRGMIMPIADRLLERNLKAAEMIRRIEDRDLEALEGAGPDGAEAGK